MGTAAMHGTARRNAKLRLAMESAWAKVRIQVASILSIQGVGESVAVVTALPVPVGSWAQDNSVGHTIYTVVTTYRQKSQGLRS